jgi:hypothetical protein
MNASLVFQLGRAWHRHCPPSSVPVHRRQEFVRRTGRARDRGESACKKIRSRAIGPASKRGAFPRRYCAGPFARGFSPALAEAVRAVAKWNGRFLCEGFGRLHPDGRRRNVSEWTTKARGARAIRSCENVPSNLYVPPTQRARPVPRTSLCHPDILAGDGHGRR